MDDIIIKYREQRDEINTIWSGWLVKHGEKYADGLAYDEMLGLVAALTMPEKRPAIQWLKTAEEHKAWRNRLEKEESDSVEKTGV